MGSHINVTNPTGGFLFGPWLSTANFLDPVLGSRYIHRCSLFAQLDPLCCSCFDFSVWASSNMLYTICYAVARNNLLCPKKDKSHRAVEIRRSWNLRGRSRFTPRTPLPTSVLHFPPLKPSLSQRMKFHPSGDNFILVLLVTMSRLVDCFMPILPRAARN